MISLSILVVEEDVGLRQLYAIVLNRRGYDVRIVSTGVDAQRALDERRFDILIYEVRSDDKQNTSVLVDLIPKIKKAGICIIVAADGWGMRDQIVPLGVQGFLVKPLDIGQLLSIIQEFGPSRV